MYIAASNVRGFFVSQWLELCDKFVYHNTIVRVSRYTLGIDTLHDMAYLR